MADRLTPERRSWLMSRVGGKNTTPEIRVRKAVHALGLRFSLHRKDLPGKPDIVLRRWKTVIFVHGCFWHRHPGCRKASMPKSRKKYWSEKFDANVERDKHNQAALEDMGWRVLVVWECETKDPEKLSDMLATHFAR